MSVEIQTMGEGGIFEIAAVVIDEVLEIQPFTDVEYEILSSARDILAEGSILEAATVATNSANTAAGLASEAASAANDAAGLANSATTSANTAAGAANSAATSATSAAGAANTAASSANSAASAANTAAATAASFVGTGPAGYYATLTALQAAYPTGDTGIYVELEYGHWYYWSGSAWIDGGLFQAPLAVVQTTGTSETDVMSQKAVTDELAALEGGVFNHIEETELAFAEKLSIPSVFSDYRHTTVVYDSDGSQTWINFSQYGWDSYTLPLSNISGIIVKTETQKVLMHFTTDIPIAGSSGSINIGDSIEILAGKSIFIKKPENANYIVFQRNTDIGYNLASVVDLLTYENINSIDINESYRMVDKKFEEIIFNNTYPITESGSYLGKLYVSPGDILYSYGVWIRDFYYGSIYGHIPSSTIKDVYEYYKAHIATEGDLSYMVPDCILNNGTIDFVGDAPALDGAAFMAFLLCQYFKLTYDYAFVRNELSYIITLLSQVPLQDGLVYNSDNPNRVGFGFEDSVHMTGKLSYASVLQYDACVRTMKMCDMLGVDKTALQTIASGIEATYQSTFWNGVYMKASTGLCSGQYDIIAAAYAVYVGLVDSQVAQTIADFIYNNKANLFDQGFCRHLPPSYYYSAEQAWESYNQERWKGINIYQSGAYWTIGLPHVIGTLVKYKGKDSVYDVIYSLAKYCQKNGQYAEWFYENNVGAKPYIQTFSAILSTLDIFNGNKILY